MKKVYYFAYGSNLSSSRLYSRIGNFSIIGTHKLMGYKLVFDTGLYAKQLFANIVKGSADDFVEGILYDIDNEQLAKLDRYEGYYLKQFFIAPDGNIATTYVNTDVWYIQKGKPELDYLNIILEGCAEHKLLTTYNTLMAYKKANYKLKGLKKWL